jgi:hypothetical protein
MSRDCSPWYANGQGQHQLQRRCTELKGKKGKEGINGTGERRWVQAKSGGELFYFEKADLKQATACLQTCKKTQLHRERHRRHHDCRAHGAAAAQSRDDILGAEAMELQPEAQTTTSSAVAAVATCR